MTRPERRTPEHIRAEIAATRSQLDAELAAFGTEAKRTGRLAGSAVAAVGGLAFVLRLVGRRRGR